MAQAIKPSEPSTGRSALGRQKLLIRDLKLLATFIRIYCGGRHRDAVKEPVVLRTHDVAAIHGRPLHLCQACRKLLTHAFMKRTACPLDPKPKCKACPEHCYAPQYRTQIREVMAYSGRRLVLSGRLDYLIHLLF
jgi:hypothetical protein